jgi:ATP phosphoribosyltransferase
MTKITLALPSKGVLATSTLDFLKNSGLKVSRPNPRQYIGSVKAIPEMQVIFQRVTDVLYKVADGTVHLGITGLDVVHEFGNDDVIVVHEDLEYGHCKLLVAVPDSWVDVTSMRDLAEVADDIRQQQKRNIRIATTYTNSARQYLHESNIHHFDLVKADGAIEAAPTLGYADAVVDITQTGTTLRENRLKELPDGIILKSQACLVANRRALKNPELREPLRIMLESFDAYLHGRRHYQLTANIVGDTPESVANLIVHNDTVNGLQGPTIAPVYGSDSDKKWFAVTIIVETSSLLQSVEVLRGIGAEQISVIPTDFVFMPKSKAWSRVEKLLDA